MSSLNLIEYIQSGLLATQLTSSKIFDAIIYVDMVKPEVEAEQFADIYDFSDVQMSFGVSGTLQAIVNNHKNSLIILSNYSVIYLIPFMQRNTENIVILNCGAGISGAINKGHAELFDLDLVKTTGAAIYEPSDSFQFFQQCNPSETELKYIRIPFLELPGSLETSWNVNYTNILSSVQAQKTMLVSGSLLGLFASALNEDQQGILDIYTLNQYYSPFTPKLKESIESTKSLSCVLDCSSESGYIDYIKGQLYDMGIHSIDFHVVTPKRGETATILPEYFWEEVQFR